MSKGVRMLAGFARMWPAALGIALMSFTEPIAAGREFARPGEPRPGASQELFATGLATLNPAALDVVQRSSLGERLGRERRFVNGNRAVETYLSRNIAPADA